MTIGLLLQNEAFEPEDVQAMSAAFEDVCKALDLADDANGTRELIAGQIIALAHRGERSRTALSDRVLREFTPFEARGVRRLAYRVFPVSPAGRVSGPPTVVECADDEEAIRLARRARDGQDVEIWEGARLVARLQSLQSPKERSGGQ
jgi:hypothetical protein